MLNLGKAYYFSDYESLFLPLYYLRALSFNTRNGNVSVVYVSLQSGLSRYWKKCWLRDLNDEEEVLD
jgi:hypothetical protein